MNTINIRNITLGEGMPKICLPIVGITLKDITAQATGIMEHPVDIIEWRADFFEDITNPNAINDAITAIRSIILDTPLLFTIRTAGEGGKLAIDFNNYRSILTSTAKNPHIDAIDVEVAITDESTVRDLIGTLKQSAVVIASNHNFDFTPGAHEICAMLHLMESLDADICKMAVMPNSCEDVLTLLSATATARTEISKPIITMSMGPLGIVSRISGETFGSCLTFGCVGTPSAPGQINANQLNTILNILHDNI